MTHDDCMRKQPGSRGMSLESILPGWRIVRDGDTIIVQAPASLGGAGVVAHSAERAPRVIPEEVLWLLADALLKVAPDLEATLRDGIKAERRAVMFGDVIANQVIAMQSAVIAWRERQDPDAGMNWIVNTLAGPGHLPEDVDEAIEAGGAQAWFDTKTAEHDAFRAAHPGPAADAAPVLRKAVAT